MCHRYKESTEQNRTEQNKTEFSIMFAFHYQIFHIRELRPLVVFDCAPGAVNVEGQTSVSCKNWHTAVRLSKDDPQPCPCSAGGGRGVSTIFNSALWIHSRPKEWWSLFKSLTIAVSSPSWRNIKSILLAVVYQSAPSKLRFIWSSQGFQK